jgi:signal transduction histidine kinase/ActR/RegA family two-component response regulator
MKTEAGVGTSSKALAWVATLAVAGAMVWLRFLVFPEFVIPLSYALALLIALWHRDRLIHWSLASGFILMATLKVFVVLPGEALPSGTDWLFWAMQLINILVTAAVVEGINHYRSALETEKAALAVTNAELEASNEELSASEEEISRQNEELQQQAEELEQQTEELEAQTEELRGVNEELVRREEILQALLDVSGPFLNEKETIFHLCNMAPRILGEGEAAAILVKRAGGMQVLACDGLKEGHDAAVIPYERSLASLVMERGETGFLENVGLRPDLAFPESNHHSPFHSVLATPLSVGSTVLGVLEVYSVQPRAWGPSQMRMIEWLGQQCGKVWETVRLREERQRAEEALLRLNEDLEGLVAERTALAEERARRLNELALELTQTEQRERRRLAKLLHDHLQQVLIAARLHAGILQRQTRDGEAADISSRIDELLKQAIDTSRTLTVELSPAVLHEAGLLAGLKWLARTFKEKYELSVDVHAAHEINVVNEDVRIFVFEAVREMLFNVVKHAGVSEAIVTVELREPDRLLARVEDQGLGFQNGEPLENLAGFGLFGIRQRAESLGGGLSIETAPGRGSMLELSVNFSQTSSPETAYERPETAAAGKRLPAKGRPHSEGAITVLLVDDHAIVRQGLSTLLADEPGIEVIGEAGDGHAAVRAARELHPRVVIMDVSMPGMDGVEATRRLCAELPEIAVIGLSMFEEADRASFMLEAGARMYMTKDGPLENLVAAIRRCGQGDPPRPVKTQMQSPAG